MLSPQARVHHRGRTGPLDDVVGTGVHRGRHRRPRGVLTTEQQTFLDGIGAHVLHLVRAGRPAASEGADAAVDVDDVYLPHLAAHGHVGA